MKERILEFLTKENKSSSVFAEEIGVQPSGISHILSGRNNPSLDFVIKMLERYKFLSTEWLLFGKGPMYKDKNTGTLFDDTEIDPGQTIKPPVVTPEVQDSNVIVNNDQSPASYSEIKKIVWFYRDNSFEEFYPRKG